MDELKINKWDKVVIIMRPSKEGAEIRMEAIAKNTFNPQIGRLVVGIGEKADDAFNVFNTLIDRDNYQDSKGSMPKIEISRGLKHIILRHHAGIAYSIRRKLPSGDPSDRVSSDEDDEEDEDGSEDENIMTKGLNRMNLEHGAKPKEVTLTWTPDVKLKKGVRLLNSV